jgi:hypothetical protein
MVVQELHDLLDTPTVMLSVSCINRWNSLTNQQRRKANKILLHHARRTGAKRLCEAWYQNAINDVTN